MELKNILPNQAEHLFQTTFEDEWILTEEEAATVIEHAINSRKKLLAWRMANSGLNEGTVLAKIASIDWKTEIDHGQILKQANSSKVHILWEREQRLKEREQQQAEREMIVRQCCPLYFERLMVSNCETIYKKPFVMDSDNKALIETICNFMSRDKRFSHDPNKGLMIRGISGLGKTFLFELIRNNPLNPVKITSMIDVAEEVKENGIYALNLNGEKIVYLDDVGTEEATINHYGTKVNWFKDFIEKYYVRKESFKNLVISTNLNAGEIEEKYGARVRSRMREMFNVVDVTGKDRRK